MLGRIVARAANGRPGKGHERAHDEHRGGSGHPARVDGVLAHPTGRVLRPGVLLSGVRRPLPSPVRSFVVGVFCMFALLVFTLVGIGAQLVDGALGMAFGVTATTLLIFSGIGPAHASAAVHLAEVGTTLVSGASHWRFRNVDWGGGREAGRARRARRLPRRDGALEPVHRGRDPGDVDDPARHRCLCGAAVLGPATGRRARPHLTALGEVPVPAGPVRRVHRRQRRRRMGADHDQHPALPRQDGPPGP